MQNMVCCNMYVCGYGRIGRGDMGDEYAKTGGEDCRTGGKLQCQTPFGVDAPVARQCDVGEPVCKLVSKVRLYWFLLLVQQKLLPEFEFMDCHLNIIARAFYNDPAFGEYSISLL